MSTEKQKLCVVGAGFVGLVTASGLAKFGHSVVCVDSDKNKIASLEKSIIPFFEPDLSELVKENLDNGRLSFSDNLKESISDRKAIFIAVGTPSGEDGRANTKFIDAVVEELVETITSDQIIVLKSTVPIGTSKKVNEILKIKFDDSQLPAVVNCPEFLREASAVKDFFYPSRIVIGGNNQDANETIAEIFRLGVDKSVPIAITNNETAELIKYAANAFLATKIGFVNELAGLCDILNINILDVTKYIGMDPRIGKDFLEPGPGWGGSCFKKDLSEFEGLAKSIGYSLLITKSTLEANEKQFDIVFSKVKELVGDLPDKQIAVLGLAFKANTSDIRYSPAIPIIGKLIGAGAMVIGYDPKASENAKMEIPKLQVASSPEEAIQNSDCILILTEWDEFGSLDYELLGKSMKQMNLVDARNLLDPETIKSLGFKYLSMGRK